MSRTGWLTRSTHQAADASSRLVRPLFYVTAAIIGGWLLCPVAAFGGIGLGVAPTYPALIQVGQTNVGVSMTITNVSTSPENGGTIALSDIFHTPSCGSDVNAQCQSADVDTGVFSVHGPISGTDGSTSCTTANWTIGSPDPTTGEVQLIPDISVVLDPPGNPGAHCTISFQVDVLALPTKDASGLAGLQTAQLGRVTGTASVDGTEGMPSGSGLTTVVAPTPTPTNTATLTATNTPTPTNTPQPTATQALRLPSEICRTKGFWGQHACPEPNFTDPATLPITSWQCEKSRSTNITQQVINAAGGLSVCGKTLIDTALSEDQSAVEALCVSPRGHQVLQLASQLTATALNCVISGETSGCTGGSSIGPEFSACNAACAFGEIMAIVGTSRIDCIDAMDCFNNGGHFIDATGFCETGTCSDNHAPCNAGNLMACADPSTATCVSLPNNCHNQPLCSTTLSLCFEPPGPAGSSQECNDAIGNACTIFSGTPSCSQ